MTLTIEQQEARKKLVEIMSKPFELPKPHFNCNFCKLRSSEKCPDLPSAEVCDIYEEDPNISHANKLIMLVDQQEPIFFKDQYKTSRVYINDKGIYKNYKIDSTTFRDYLTETFFIHFNKAPSITSLKEAIVALEGLTRNTKIINIKNRVNVIENETGQQEIWIDLCNKEWQSIKITETGYEIINKTPPIFRRFDHMEALCTPKKDGKDGKDDTPQELLTSPLLGTFSLPKKREGEGKNSYEQSSLPSIPSLNYIFKIFDYLRVSDDDKKLVLTALVSYFFIGRPYVVLSIYGPSGRGKSTGSKIIKKLIDPSSTIILDMSKNRDQFLQDLDHHFFCAFDNVSYISNEYSDVICRTSTGYGIAKRLLYTNDKDFLRMIQRPVCLNGIPVAITREDLLKRALLIESLPLRGEEKTEQELYLEFNRIKPFILDELYILVSKVMAILPGVKPKTLYRMADFTKIGCAVAEVLGFDHEWFLDTYKNKLDEQLKEAIWNNYFGNILYEFIDSVSEWTGSPTDLWTELKKKAKELDISTRVKEFPKASNIMSKKINELVEPFSRIGVKIIFSKGTVREWTIINEKNKGNQESLDESKGLKKGIDGFFELCQFCKQPILDERNCCYDFESKPAHKWCLKSFVEGKMK